MKLEDQEWVINPNTGNRIDMKKLLKDQAIALSMVESQYPFFARLVRNLTFIYTFQVPTQATDGTRLFVNPEFTRNLSLRMKVFVMMHETMHCALNHMDRGKYHDHQRSNIAADYEVNGLLVADGIVSPSDIKQFLYDAKYEDWAYERIYADNPSGPQAPKPQKGGQQGSGQQGSGQQQQGNQQSGGGSGGQDGQQQDGQGNSQADDKARAEAADSGTSMGGFISQESGSKIARSEGYDEEDSKQESDAKVSEHWRKEAIDAATKTQGVGSSHITRLFKNLYLTNYNWKQELKRFIGNALSKIDDRTAWGRKKILATTGEIKKYSKTGEHDMNSVVFCIDTSGSVSDDLLNRILSECYTIVARKGIKKVTYVYYDTSIRSIETNDNIRTAGLSSDAVKRIKDSRSAGKHAKGGGGTDYGTVRKKLDEMFKGRHLELVMVFTDGYDTASEMRCPRVSKNAIFVVYDNPDFKSADNSKVIKLNSKDLGGK